MKKPVIKIISGDNSLRMLRNERGRMLETIAGAERQALDKVNEEIELYSITPATFSERVFEDTIDNILFMDKYNTTKAEVTRFGIHTTSSKVMDSIRSDGIKIFNETNRAASTVKSAAYKPDEAQKIPLASLEKELLNKAISYLLESDIRTVLVDILARVNGGTDNGFVKIKDYSFEKRVEICVDILQTWYSDNVDHAREINEIPALVDVDLSQSKDVLVQIIIDKLQHAQKASGDVVESFLNNVFTALSANLKTEGNLLETYKSQKNILEVHTVVLYKNPSVRTMDPREATSAESASATTATSNTSKKVQILVIDPSNFLFSSHLSNFNVQGVQITVDTSASEAVETVSSRSKEITKEAALPEFTINTIHKSLQIYKPAGAIGPKLDQYRDCIDVAVKIAFGLNQMSEGSILLDSRQVESCVVIQNLSNSKDLDNSILTKKLPVRVKQASDINVVIAFNKVEKVINNNFELLSKIYSPKEQLDTLHSCEQLLQRAAKQSILPELCSYNQKECVDKIVGTVLGSHQELLGIVDDILMTQGEE